VRKIAGVGWSWSKTAVTKLTYQFWPLATTDARCGPHIQDHGMSVSAQQHNRSHESHSYSGMACRKGQDSLLPNCVSSCVTLSSWIGRTHPSDIQAQSIEPVFTQLHHLVDKTLMRRIQLGANGEGGRGN
jgi:hypothetical protein